MKKLLLLTIALIAGSTLAWAADFYPQEKAEGYLKKVLKTKNFEILQSIDLSDKTQDGRRTVAYRLKTKDGEGFQYAVFTESRGRYDMFDYLMITKDNGTVLSVKVIKYRSEHGGEVAAKKWLSQFENFGGGNLEYGSDISAISGATLSASSLTRDIPEVVELLQQVLSQKD